MHSEPAKPVDSKFRPFQQAAEGIRTLERLHGNRFARRDGCRCFVERRVRTDLVGDVSRHLHAAADE
jgi:hypothetical protein